MAREGRGEAVYGVRGARMYDVVVQRRASRAKDFYIVGGDGSAGPRRSGREGHAWAGPVR